MDMKDYIPAARAAEMLGYAASARSSNLSARAKAGKIPGAVKIGRDWFLPAAWVSARIAEEEARAKGGKPRKGRPPGRPKKQAEAAPVIVDRAFTLRGVIFTDDCDDEEPPPEEWGK